MSLPDRDSARRLDALVREHQSALQAFALKLCGHASDAHDLCQDTFERALKSEARGEARSNDRAWLFTVLHHLFVDRYRRRMREPRMADIEEVEVPAPAAADAEPPPAWTNVTAAEVAAALKQLDPEFAEVYRLHELDGLGYAEIAAKLGAPVSTIGTRIMRARRKLRAILQAQVEKGS